MSLNERSRKNLEGVHPHLVAVVEKARERVDFLVTEGLRTKERQAQLIKIGRSKTKNSRHLYGLAVDLCDMDGKYDVPDMHEIAKAMKVSALELGVPIEWGGDWLEDPNDNIGWDSPHFQLPKSKYPDNGANKPRVLKPNGPTIVTAKGVAADTVWDVASMAAPGVVPPSPLGIVSKLSQMEIPAPPVDAVSSVAGWQSAAETVGAFASSQYAVIAICAIVFAVIVPKIVERLAP